MLFSLFSLKIGNVISHLNLRLGSRIINVRGGGERCSSYIASLGARPLLRAGEQEA